MTAVRQSGSCGTLAGYSRHRRRGERRCGQCLEARASYDRSHRPLRTTLELADPVAVERAVRGERVPLTRADRRAAVLVMTAAGATRSQIMRTLRMSSTNVRAHQRRGVAGSEGEAGSAASLLAGAS